MAERTTITSEKAAELERLWREYAKAVERVLEIMRTRGTDGAALPLIIEQDAKAGRAMRRIKTILAVS